LGSKKAHVNYNSHVKSGENLPGAPITNNHGRICTNHNIQQQKISRLK